MAQQTPYEQIRFINDAIKDRAEKKQPTFFSVKLERFGALTPLATKEAGDTFYETIIQYLTKYDMSAMVVELYNGKSYNIKEPFQTFKIEVKRRAELSGGYETKTEELKVSPVESIISTEKHFFSMAEKERQVMMLEFDIKRLQYENEELKKKNKKRKNYISELESELEKTEKDKKNSFGNISLGLAGANLVEKLVKSPFGIAALKGFGMSQEQLSGLMGSDISSPNQTSVETKSVASIISTSKEQAPPENLSEDAKKRVEVKKAITDFLDSCPDNILRMYYELIQYLGSDAEVIGSVTEQIKTFREKQKAIIQEKINANASGKTNTKITELRNTLSENEFNDSS